MDKSQIYKLLYTYESLKNNYENEKNTKDEYIDECGYYYDEGYNRGVIKTLESVIGDLENYLKGEK